MSSKHEDAIVVEDQTKRGEGLQKKGLDRLDLVHDAMRDLTNHTLNIMMTMKRKPKSDVRDDMTKHVTNASAKDGKQYDHYKTNQKD